MTLISGDLITVTSGVADVVEVRVRARRIRPAGTGLMMDDAERVPFDDGYVTFEAEPGEAILMIVRLGGVESIPIIVPDEESASLRTVVENQETYPPAVIGDAARLRNEAIAAAERAEAGADRVGTAEQVGAWADQAGLAAEAVAQDKQAVSTDRQAVEQIKADVTGLAEQVSTKAGEVAQAAGQVDTDKQQVSQDKQSVAADRQAVEQAVSGIGDSVIDAEQARDDAVQAKNTASGHATTATQQATEAGLAAVRAEQATAGKADLVGGKIPSSQIPEVALTKPHPVADRAAMLSLPDVQQGDVAIIPGGTDQGSYMLGEGDPTEFESWIPLASGAGGVQSVNGQVGTVNLGPTDVGAATAAHTHSPESIGAAPASHTHSMNQVDGLDAAIAGAKSYADSADTAWSNSLTTRMNSRTALFWGAGPPSAPYPSSSVPGDLYLDALTMNLYKFT